MTMKMHVVVSLMWVTVRAHSIDVETFGGLHSRLLCLFAELLGHFTDTAGARGEDATALQVACACNLPEVAAAVGPSRCAASHSVHSQQLTDCHFSCFCHVFPPVWMLSAWLLGFLHDCCLEQGLSTAADRLQSAHKGTRKLSWTTMCSITISTRPSAATARPLRRDTGGAVPRTT